MSKAELNTTEEEKQDQPVQLLPGTGIDDISGGYKLIKAINQQNNKVIYVGEVSGQLLWSYDPEELDFMLYRLNHCEPREIFSQTSLKPIDITNAIEVKSQDAFDFNNPTWKKLEGRPR
ncbi:MAG: hypothetical protein LBJ95_03890 [Oscillospiraceae bacterium]|nr:hypothetical protein [Oscillospiraceae bacterium]